MSTLGSSNDSTAAIEHRLAALHGMSSAMQLLDQSEVLDQAIHDALLATCMLFQIQSTYLSDGFQDYLIMGRGTGLLMQRVLCYETFDSWQLRNLRDFVDRRLHLLDTGSSTFRKSQAAALTSSLASLEPFCLTAAEKSLCNGMQGMSRALQQPRYEGTFRAHNVLH